MTGGIRVETVIRLYCNGPAHNHQVITLGWVSTEDRVREAIAEAGWKTTPGDDKIYCPLHARMAT